MPLIAEFDQLRIVWFIDIVGADALQHLAEDVKLPVDTRVGRRERLSAREAYRRRADGDRGKHHDRPKLRFPH